MNKVANLEEKLKEIVSEKLGVSQDRINQYSNLVDDLGADSLDLVEMIMAVEEMVWGENIQGINKNTFEISDDDSQEITTFKDLISYINRRLSSY
ncbi:acyl carrier protein [Candidatus Falkowbacteria bacterium]|nr:acyl carrier protein [Candidatus Falkowbacteria bacterium]